LYVAEQPVRVEPELACHADFVVREACALLDLGPLIRVCVVLRQAPASHQRLSFVVGYRLHYYEGRCTVK
jgi:hypothetical protein